MSKIQNKIKASLLFATLLSAVAYAGGSNNGGEVPKTSTIDAGGIAGGSNNGGWREGGVPPRAENLIDFLEKLHAIPGTNTGPTLEDGDSAVDTEEADDFDGAF